MESDTTQQQRRFWFICLGLAVVTAAVYAVTLGHDFISFDDPDYVTQNPRVLRGITLSGIVWAFSSIHACNWHPLTTLTHMLDCQWFGVHPAWPHFVNLLLHTANSVLLFAALQRMTGARWRSAVVAALFAWHPLHIESVAWIAERKDVLCGFFWMLGLLLYAEYARKPDRRGYVLTLVCFAAGLLSKAMMVTFPCVLLLLDFWPLRRLRFATGGAEVEPSAFPARPWKFLLLEKVPFMVLSVGAGLVTFLIQHTAGATVSLQSLPLSQRLQNAVVAYVTYLRKMIWPDDLAIFYPHAHSIPLWWVIGSLGLLAVASGLALWRGRREPFLLVGWLWYLGTLFPVIGIIQVGNQGLADRYTYLPLIGIFIALVWGVAGLVEQRPAMRTLSSSATAILLMACLVVTHLQLRTWRDSVALFSHALEVTRDNFVARDNLGMALDRMGKTEEAITNIQRAIELAPQAVFPLNNLGWIYAREKKYDLAQKYYEAALRLKPDFRQVYSNLGLLYTSQERWEEALKNYTECIRLDPEIPEPHYLIGVVLVRLNRLDEAMAHFRQAIRLRPDYPEVESQMGGIYQKWGQSDSAYQHYARAVQLNPEFAHPRVKLGLLLAQQGQFEEAKQQLGRAIQLEPTNDAAFYNLAGVFQAQGELDQAAAAFARVVELKPGDADARTRLGDVLMQVGQAESALKQYQEALVLKPDSPHALGSLAFLRATSARAELRDLPEAVRLAERANELTGHANLGLLTILDQVYAAAGRFTDAITVAQQVNSMAEAAQQKALADQAAKRLEAYRAGHIYRD